MSVGALPDVNALNNEIASWCQSVGQTIYGAIGLRKRLEAIISTAGGVSPAPTTSLFGQLWPNQPDQQQIVSLVQAMKDCGDVFAGGATQANAGTQTAQSIQVKDMDGSGGGAVRSVTLQNYAAVLLPASGFRG